MADLKMETPLNGQSHAMEGLSLKELEPCTRIILRGNIEAMTGAVESVVGLSATGPVNTFVSANSNSLFWMGPDERLVYSTADEADVLVNQLREKMSAEQHAVVDVSDYYTVIQISGPKARAALVSGTPLDVHPRVFKTGQCAQTRFGNASILLSRIGDDTYDVQVRWSFAEYVWNYLCKVGRYV